MLLSWGVLKNTWEVTFSFFLGCLKNEWFINCSFLFLNPIMMNAGKHIPSGSGDNKISYVERCLASATHLFHRVISKIHSLTPSEYEVNYTPS